MFRALLIHFKYFSSLNHPSWNIETECFKSGFYSRLQANNAYNLRHQSFSIFQINTTIIKSSRGNRCPKHKQNKQYYKYYKEIFIKINFFHVPDQKPSQMLVFQVFQVPFSNSRLFQVFQVIQAQWKCWISISTWDMVNFWKCLLNHSSLSH